jgi:mRNA interferase MazF
MHPSPEALVTGSEADHLCRPVLVVAVPNTEADFVLLWGLMITSGRHTAWPSDVPIVDLTDTGLSHASLVRPAKIATLDARLAHRIGTLPPQDRTKVQASLNQLFPGTFGG